jgi:transposase
LLQVEKDPTQIADLAQRQLRGKIPQLEKALEGNLTEHHRFMLRLLWKG